MQSAKRSDAAASHGLDGKSHNERSDHGHDQAADVEASIEAIARHKPPEKPTDDGADNPQHDVQEPPLFFVGLRDEAGEPAGQRPKDQPGNQAHSCRSFRRLIAAGDRSSNYTWCAKQRWDKW